MFTRVGDMESSNLKTKAMTVALATKSLNLRLHGTSKFSKDILVCVYEMFSECWVDKCLNLSLFLKIHTHDNFS